MRSDRYADEQLNTEDKLKTESSEEATIADNGSVTETVEAPDAKEKKGIFGRKVKSAGADPQSMTEIDLAKMKKKDLLEIMLAQSKEIDRLREQVADLEAKLANREFEFSRIGSIAEASLAVTNIFTEAEEAAKIYLENIRRSYERQNREHSND